MLISNPPVPSHSSGLNYLLSGGICFCWLDRHRGTAINAIFRNNITDSA